jgi:hypothetical protein
LTYNLTNLLTDSITAAVAPRLSNSIFEALGASSVVEVVCVCVCVCLVDVLCVCG